MIAFKDELWIISYKVLDFNVSTISITLSSSYKNIFRLSIGEEFWFSSILYLTNRAYIRLALIWN